VRQPQRHVAARRRVLDGIGHQVEDDLLQPVTVADDARLINFGDSHLHRAGDDLHLAAHLQQQPIQVNGLAFQRQVAGVGLRQHQQIADQPRHPLSLRANIPQRLRIGPTHPLQQIHVAANGRERCAQLMRDVGQEAALCIEQPLQALQRLVEGDSEPPDLIVGVFDGNAPREVVGARDLQGRLRDNVERLERAAGREPADEGGQHHREHPAAHQHDQQRRTGGLHRAQGGGGLQIAEDLAIGADEIGMYPQVIIPPADVAPTGFFLGQPDRVQGRFALLQVGGLSRKRPIQPPDLRRHVERAQGLVGQGDDDDRLIEHSRQVRRGCDLVGGVFQALINLAGQAEYEDAVHQQAKQAEDDREDRGIPEGQT